MASAQYITTAAAGIKSRPGRPLQYFKGVGPVRAKRLESIGLVTAQDLLSYYPRDWERRHELQDFNQPHPDGRVVIRGKVSRVQIHLMGAKLGLFKVVLESHGAFVQAVWFKRLSVRYDVFKKFRHEIVPGAWLWVVGRSEPSLLEVREVHVEEYYVENDGRLPADACLHVGRIVPIYPLTEGIPAQLMRNMVFKALCDYAGDSEEVLPPEIMQKRDWMPFSKALWQIHFPDSAELLEKARRRLAYQEFFLLETALGIKKHQTQRTQKPFHYELKKHLLTPFRKRLGFDFTASQKKVINEIFRDMQAPYPMTRLLQGDVGSGKTVVALSALLLAVENGHQGALMAPTEVLAEQHYITLTRLLRGIGVKVGILTSRAAAAQRQKRLKEIAAGKIDIVVGTHAILEKEVQFPQLSMAVIDEQHRFGVRQRALLRNKGNLLDLLVMTATPIPRTLALSLYGDLDVSTLTEMPPGRIPVETIHASEKEAFDFLRGEILSGRQGYVVYPIIDESSRAAEPGQNTLKAAKIEAERLQQKVFPEFKVDLIYGSMSGAKKEKVMQAFSEGKTHILVATPVVEVGLDVPNASVVVIQEADRFGLASLHQLRGRVGRGRQASRCYLVGDPATHEAEARLRILCETNDGFKISEQDLRLRGPGQIMGTQQHGEWEFKIADLFRDLDLLEMTREDNRQILEKDISLVQPEHLTLRRHLIDLYQNQWHWIDLA
ncbi:MAG: ATP-dependent DNA helicase RecG [Elusimicrobia bacterium RIFCSPLOWO2_12_FULL_59_9]|nr:MAG: ATP-dependent DNA helicase RecG [Elusimicrobia bacterium RIFCSPLOWO2_12_FULL_59_9]